MRAPAHVEPVWDVARPAGPSRTTGVRMAGFRDRGTAGAGAGAGAGQRAIPHPGLTLVLEFGAGPLIVENGADRHGGSLVAGLGLAAGDIRVRGDGFEAVQVRLSPLVAHAVLGVPPSALDGAMVPLDDLWGREAARVRDRLAGLRRWDDRFALADVLLARRAAEPDRPRPDPEVAWAWRRIIGSRGLARVDGLADEVGWSRKRLWSRFRTQVGLPPKRAATLVRFDHAVHRLVAGVSPARAAAESGYADQSHLHRDVVSFAGLTPAAVIAEPFLAVDEFAWPTRL
ncbi:AraC family transcriptional regulator [Actinomadura gamaensis]|uniref:Helix-turn-helix domain-containing protein n=1 Tax=Actinomadura gamaensis TaxID=1763541 RepID=A0ABV9TP54_9ACTN